MKKMNKYHIVKCCVISVEADVIAETEEDAVDKFTDEIYMDTYTNGTVGPECGDYDYIDNLDCNADGDWCDRYDSIEIVETDVDDPLGDDDEEDEEDY